MLKALAKYWVIRFGVVGGLLTAALVAVELARHGAGADLSGAVGWGLIGGALAAAVNTYWSRHRVCPVPGLTSRDEGAMDDGGG